VMVDVWMWMCFPFSVDVSGEVIYLVNTVMNQDKNVECWVRLPLTLLILLVAWCISRCGLIDIDSLQHLFLDGSKCLRESTYQE
jgi:hypothetical protein